MTGPRQLADRLSEWRQRTDAGDATLLPELMAEVEYLTAMVTTVQAQRMFDSFHCFSGIRDDCCPACGGRVRVDESDPARLRIVSDRAVRAS
jgi:hypothetical protein